MPPVYCGMRNWEGVDGESDGYWALPIRQGRAARAAPRATRSSRGHSILWKAATGDCAPLSHRGSLASTTLQNLDPRIGGCHTIGPREVPVVGPRWRLISLASDRNVIGYPAPRYSPGGTSPGGAGALLGTFCGDHTPLGTCPKPSNPLNPRDLCVRMASTGGGVIGRRRAPFAF